MESSRPKEKRKTKEHITPRNGNRHEIDEQELDGIRKGGPGQSGLENAGRRPMLHWKFHATWQLSEVVPVILWELMLPDGFNPVSPSFTVRDVIIGTPYRRVLSSTKPRTVVNQSLKHQWKDSSKQYQMNLNFTSLHK
ncbi:unnamed protein product [Schistosoma margrebowiei]|uniref:Uncharacterized protein n=1 Tax=Schistosoma margrebowiei TaxID=48269 RepID=A0A183N287_9TREM|nr:unnamed protein product [Schistosoma margrebowiei]